MSSPDPTGAPFVGTDEFSTLQAYLHEQVRMCVRDPVDRFAHRWLAPMPPSAVVTAALVQQHAPTEPAVLRDPSTGDGFAYGDYGLGLFHHDVAESAVELCRDPELAQVCLGSLLCLLDCAAGSGRIHRAELPHKMRDPEPAKPVIAQLALRAVEGGGASALERAERHRVLPRVWAHLRNCEQTTIGGHGLFLTPSPRASGFDNDLLAASSADGTVEGPDTNALMVLEYEAIGTLARMLGDASLHERALSSAEALRRRIEQLLWVEDERGGFYCGLRWQHGVGSLDAERLTYVDPEGIRRPLESWVGLLPLYAGIPTPARAEAMLARLTDPSRYWGPAGVRTVPADSPFFHQAARVLLWDERKNAAGPVSNWCGPVWTLSNYYLTHGLKLYGHHEIAAELARKTLSTLADDLHSTGSLHENYDDRGRGLWPRRGTFVSWNVLALTLQRACGAQRRDRPARLDTPGGVTGTVS